MKTPLLILFSILFLAGCMKTSLSNGQIQHLLGISPDQVSNFHYFFEGNHAGYLLVAQFDASPEIRNAITRNLERQSFRERDEYTAVIRRSAFLLSNIVERAPWLDFDWNGEYTEYVESGANSFTSSFSKHVYIDEVTNKVYVVSSGI